MASRDVKKLLFDIKHAGEMIRSFVRGKSHEEYKCERMLQSAVVWGIIEERLPLLREELKIG